MVDADRKCVRGGGAAADPNGAAVLVDLGVQFLAAITEEAFEPFDRLEADHVIVEHCLEQSRVKGKRDEQAGRSEERRGGNECVSKCRSRWSPLQIQITKNIH